MDEAPDEVTTVVVVGAGPAGLVLAHLLQREGIPFVVVERLARDELPGLPKAGVVEYRTVELLRREGLADKIVRFDAENHCCEFRTPNESVVFDYGSVTGGRPHYIYPQHQLVARLCDAVVETGAAVRFRAPVLAVDDSMDGATVTVDGNGRIRAQAVVACDGSRSTIARSMPGLMTAELMMSVRWLAVIGLAPPLVAHTIYAAHPDGFAGHMRRGPEQTRYYLEVPASDGLADWPEHRIRNELTVRLGAGSQLDGVTFVEPTLLDLRMRMPSEMQRGRIFLTGDAAHLITPAGGKGMNLAIQDSVELAHGLIECYGPQADGARLANYTATRLPAVWRTQSFSNWMLRLILAGSDGASTPPAFGRGLREGWVSSLQRDPLLARWFSYAYAGVDPD
jgi:p-hydroxybenzoate 3-monooxygenase